jgi:hypothetical protein
MDFLHFSGKCFVCLKKIACVPYKECSITIINYKTIMFVFSYILEASVNPLGSEKKGMADLNETDCTLSKFTNPENLELGSTFCLVLQRNCKDYEIYQEKTIVNTIHDNLSTIGYFPMEQKLRRMDETGRVLLCTKDFRVR